MTDATRVVEAAKELDAGRRVPFLNKHLTDEQKWVLGRDSFKFFLNILTYNWLSPKPEEWDRPQEYVMDWHDKLHAGPDPYMILAGRKHTKTTWALAEILHGCEYTEYFEVLYWANTQPQVSSRMSELEEMIKQNAWLQNTRVNGDAPGGLQKEFTNGSKLHTVSVSGSVEGSHVDLSVGDDPLKEIGHIPDERVVEWYERVIVPMRNQEGRDVIIGTRKRPQDIYEILRTRGEDLDFEDIPSYQLAEYPAIREPWLIKYGDDRQADLADESLYTAVEAPDLATLLTDGLSEETVHVLWPEARGVDFLKANLGRQGEPAFKREFCMVFTQVEDAIISRDAIDDLCSVDAQPPHTLAEAGDIFERVVVGGDPATAQGGDNAAFVTVGLDGEDYRHVLDVSLFNGISPSRFKRTLQSLYARYEPDTIVLESNGMQAYIVEDAVEFDRELPIRAEHTSGRKHSWKNGIPKMANDIERGVYRFYRKGDDDGTEQLINSLTSLRMNADDKLEGHTPDSVMALYQAEKDLSSVSGTVVDMGETPQHVDEERAEDVREREAGVEAVLSGEGSTSEIGEALLSMRESGGGRY